jgi:uncharacterized protein YjdB
MNSKRATARTRAWGAAACAALAVCAATLLGTTPVHASSTRKLVDIAIDPLTVSLIPGRTQAFHATGIYSDKTTADLTAAVVWSTRDDSVATIDATGLATAIAEGRTEVRAVEPTTRVSARTAAKIEVPELDSLTVEPATANLRIDGHLALKALGTYADGTTGVDLTDKVQWTSKKTTVVKIDTDATGKPIAVGVAVGKTQVIARDADTGIKSDSATGLITVVGDPLSIAVSPASRVLRVGERSRFKATATFAGGLTSDVSFDVTWSTGNPAVATIDVEGRATGVALGSTAVSATDPTSGVSSTASAADGQVIVVGPMQSLEIKPTSAALALGASLNLKASAHFADYDKSVNVTTKVEWTSTDPSKVSVDRLGVARCLSVGSVMISARDALSGVTSTASGKDALVRCGIPVVGVQVQPATLTVKVGKSKKVKAFLVYADNSKDEITKTVKWTSTNLAVATIDREEPNIGRVNGQASGTTTIVADDPATGLSSTGSGGVSCAVTVP